MSFVQDQRDSDRCSVWFLVIPRGNGHARDTNQDHVLRLVLYDPIRSLRAVVDPRVERTVNPSGTPTKVRILTRHAVLLAL
jgi:hypothetical protein